MLFSLFSQVVKPTLLSKARYATCLLLILAATLRGDLPLPAVEELTLEEKVGQLLMVHFRGHDLSEEVERLIHEAHVGGVIYYQWANDLSTPSQIKSLSTHLQQSASSKEHPIPLLIATDQEGGVVNRITNGVTVFPGNFALGQTNEPQLAEESAYAMACELLTIGINMNLAPVVDVHSNPFNPIIGIRAFSSDPKEVARFGSKALAGYQRAHMVATLKHFPGHGDVKLDSHETLPTVYKSIEELEEIELLPFQVLASKTPVIMTAHLMVPALDPTACTTFSRSTIEGLLRGQMGYEGVILTDSLVMQGLLEQCDSIEEAALRSLQAGHDLLLLGGKQLFNHQIGFELNCEDILRIHRFLVEAVKQGLLTEERVDASVKRLLNLKKTYRLFETGEEEEAVELSSEENRQLAKKIAQIAIQTIQGSYPLPDQDQSFALILPDVLREEIERTDWLTIGKQVKPLFFKNLNPSESESEHILAECETADICIFFSYNGWRYVKQLDLFHAIQNNCPQTVALVVRDPKDALLLSHSERLLCTFSPSAYSLQAAKNQLFGGDGE
ncbi:putative beta-N-acetylglucosaminidase [Candidatus Protochlamydia naegleriophila]|uniref:Putative beta-N-acetylglucosaminidase n=1 Tax=Candidatus Protochlamydia naegleriophila TaxID=389348 RepID=A0A0U5JF33_9BACT|nr:glycoside hydrolase family 3 protein [Candidatus Protochlamydia naegleriophila]CUI17783.1 putative beta-N-acetylglucosaminidase [Candidatus Protochlamydia naegleriophila]